MSYDELLSFDQNLDQLRALIMKLRDCNGKTSTLKRLGTLIKCLTLPRLKFKRKQIAINATPRGKKHDEGSRAHRPDLSTREIRGNQAWKQKWNEGVSFTIISSSAPWRIIWLLKVVTFRHQHPKWDPNPWFAPETSIPGLQIFAV